MPQTFPTGFSVRDAALKKSLALPNGAATTTSTGIDINNGPRGTFDEQVTLKVEAPALTTGELPDTKTMTYDLFHAASSDFSDEVSLQAAVLVQTGAGGAGDVAASVGISLPTDVRAHVRLKATNSGAGDASGKSVVLALDGA